MVLCNQYNQVARAGLPIVSRLPVRARGGLYRAGAPRLPIIETPQSWICWGANLTIQALKMEAVCFVRRHLRQRGGADHMLPPASGSHLSDPWGRLEHVCSNNTFRIIPCRAIKCYSPMLTLSELYLAQMCFYIIATLYLSVVFLCVNCFHAFYHGGCTWFRYLFRLITLRLSMQVVRVQTSICARFTGCHPHQHSNINYVHFYYKILCCFD